MDIEKTMRSIRGRNMDAKHFSTALEAADYLASQISGTTVGIGGSKTIESLGIYERLCENNSVFWHWKDGASSDVFRAAAEARVYLSSVNAIAETGELVNIDGRGNRVAALSFGEGRTIYVVAGTNKICPDLASAIERARNVAAPENVKKLPGKRPCGTLGSCVDCRSSDRGCCVMQTVMFKPINTEKFEVILIDEKLGF